MKTFLIFIFFIFFTGCSKQNAFVEFHMTKDEELGASSFQSSKIIDTSGNVNGFISCIYLNEIYPNKYKNDDYFFIYIYSKVSSKIEQNLKLNQKYALKIKQLENENEFSNLVQSKNDWSKYYLVTFKQTKDRDINLVFENDQFSSAVLKYQKDRQ